jgi:hypothetical protein
VLPAPVPWAPPPAPAEEPVDPPAGDAPSICDPETWEAPVVTRPSSHRLCPPVSACEIDEECLGDEGSTTAHCHRRCDAVNCDPDEECKYSAEAEGLMCFGAVTVQPMNVPAAGLSSWVLGGAPGGLAAQLAATDGALWIRLHTNELYAVPVDERGAALGPPEDRGNVPYLLGGFAGTPDRLWSWDETDVQTSMAGGSLAWSEAEPLPVPLGPGTLVLAGDRLLLVGADEGAGLAVVGAVGADGLPIGWELLVLPVVPARRGVALVDGRLWVVDEVGTTWSTEAATIGLSGWSIEDDEAFGAAGRLGDFDPEEFVLAGLCDGLVGITTVFPPAVLTFALSEPWRGPWVVGPRPELLTFNAAVGIGSRVWAESGGEVWAADRVGAASAEPSTR